MHWSQTQFLEGHSSAQFSSNPNQTHLIQIIKVFRITRNFQACVVWSWLKISSAELWPSRKCVWDQCFSGTLRPLIPQQILHHSRSFKPHKARVVVKARRLESDLCRFVGIKMWLLGKTQRVKLWSYGAEWCYCGKTLSGEGIELLWYSQACVTNPAVTWGTSSQACTVIDVWDRSDGGQEDPVGQICTLKTSVLELWLINYIMSNQQTTLG